MDAQTLLNFMEEVGKLKVFPRSGWLLRGMKNPESIADHCYRTSVLAMILADFLIDQGIEIDSAKVMKIALLHDVAESQIGDIPYPATRYLPEDVKEAAERHAMQNLLDGFGALGQRYVTLWREFEDGETIEGKLVRAADKLEMMIQVAEYESVGVQSLGDFWDNMANFKGFEAFPIVQQLMDLLNERHNSK